MRRWRENHREEWCEYSRKHYREHPDRVRERRERRRARQRGLSTDFTTQDWQNCIFYWNGCCAICGREEAQGHVLAMDHWIPLASPACPGTIPDNILPLCHNRKGHTGGCNNSKKHSNPIEWLIKRLGPEAAETKLAEIEAFFATVRRTDGAK
jgi:hypothetical protein